METQLATAAQETTLPAPQTAPMGQTAEQLAAVSTAAARPANYPLGVSRPPLEIADLPTPEQVFKVKRLGWEEMLLLALGPGVIALGLSIGSGEWILGPLSVSQYGLKGIFWVVLISTILQVFYNIELARYTLATGEPPVVGFGRTPPGYLLWVPLALLSFIAAFILGGWAVSAGSSLYALIVDRPVSEADLEIARLIGIGLMLSVFLLLMVGRKIERTMEAVQGLFLPYILIGLAMVTFVAVPPSYLGGALAALVIPSRPPQGVDITLLGALAGFAALASGLNFMFVGYYRDKGYAMGHYTGYLPSLFNPQPAAIRPAGVTFPEDEQNALRWKRWFRILLLDQWGIYFVGALLGIALPSILISYLIINSGQPAPGQNEILYAVSQLLSQRYGQLVGSWALITGFVILYSTQIAVLELLARNLTDGLYGVSGRFRRWAKNDPRRFYYAALAGLILVISIIIHLDTPVGLSVLSGNLSNFAAMLFPLAMIYLNLKLPRPARITWWSILALAANALFFGFFFINFLAVQMTGSPLVRF